MEMCRDADILRSLPEWIPIAVGKRRQPILLGGGDHEKSAMTAVGRMLQLGDCRLHAREWQDGQRDEAMGSNVVKFLSEIIVVGPHAVLLQLGVHSYHETLATDPGRVGE